MNRIIWILALVTGMILPGRAQELRPERLEVEGTRYQVIYDGAEERGSQVTADLLSATGVAGRALFLVKDGQTRGTLYLGPKSFSLTLDAARTNIVELPRHETVRCNAQRDSEDRPLPKANLSAFSLPSEIVVDLIAFYTLGARSRAGGDAAVRGRIELAVAEANQVFRDSGTPVVLRLVHTAEVAYSEAATVATDLDRFWRAGDGFMDNVQALKSQYKADIATLFVGSDEPAEAGRGYILSGSSTKAYSVVKIQFAVGYYIFAHEIGHNFGCAHDRPNATVPGAASYSYGHHFQVGAETFRTVMAYEPGQRLGYFSTPLKTYRGVPLGTAAEDNARTIRERAAFISQIELGLPPSPPVIVQQPQSLLVPAGTMISLRVEAVGGTPLSYQWFRNGAAVPNATNATHGLGRAVASCEGTYTARVKNLDGTTTSQPASVKLLDPPTIVSQPRNVEVPAGAALQLDVTATSPVAMTYQWRKNGVAIASGNGRAFTLTACRLDDSADYSVTVSNAAGATESARAVVRVTGAVVPGPPEGAGAQFLGVRPLGNGEVTVLFRAEVGRRYNLQASADLNAWSSVQTIVPTEIVNEIVDPDPAGAGRKFYRILLIP